MTVSVLFTCNKVLLSLMILHPGADVGFEQVTYTVREEVEMVEVCVSMNGTREINLTVELSTQPLTAVGKCVDIVCTRIIYHCSFHSAEDYSNLTAFGITFSPSDRLRCVNISITNDNLFEDQEFFMISFQPTDSSLVNVTRAQARVSIISEDSEF